ARRHRGGGDAVLARAGLGDDAGLAHALGQQNLAQAIVDLVRAGVIEVFALEINLRSPEMLGEARGEIKRTFAAHIMGEQPVQFLMEGRVLLRRLIGLFQVEQERHQGLGDKAAAEGAEMTLRVRPAAQGVGQGTSKRVHAPTFALAAATNSAMRASLLTPGALSTPEETSTRVAPLTSIAWATFSGLRPPARNQGRRTSLSF